MGKGHRDNHRARKKRGPTAFAKKAQRRSNNSRRNKCVICGTNTRKDKLEEGMCPKCYERLGAAIEL